VLGELLYYLVDIQLLEKFRKKFLKIEFQGYTAKVVVSEKSRILLFPNKIY